MAHMSATFSPSVNDVQIKQKNKHSKPLTISAHKQEKRHHGSIHTLITICWTEVGGASIEYSEAMA